MLIHLMILLLEILLYFDLFLVKIQLHLILNKIMEVLLLRIIFILVVSYHQMHNLYENLKNVYFNVKNSS
jgi:hypothetical protein